ncbi:MAG: cadherin-like beta sandwich domain-containing protein, partial [Nitrospira sp. LK70]|nr:cadherin-like beta sandwich domain-containing protein [Nitrospira sp. LK70]
QGTSSGQGRSISLGPAGSSTDIDILVTAPNGSQKTYVITVNKAALGGNNNLSALTAAPGTLTPVFDSNTTAYTVDVTSDVTSVTVTATLADTSASMTINGQGTSSGQASPINLGAEGSSTNVTIVVTAPNGNSKTYTITVNRAAPPPP